MDGLGRRELSILERQERSVWPTMAVPLDGSAHIIEDRGYLFLFNECANDQIGSIPLKRMDRTRTGRYFRLAADLPEEKWLARAVKRGEKITCRLRPRVSPSFRGAR